MRERGDGDQLQGAHFPKEAMLIEVYLRQAFTRILKRAGLRRVRLHDLRHSYASNLLQAGAPI